MTLSQIGLGTGPLGGLYAESPRSRAMQVLECAWENGIRYFDTAPFYGYGLAERRVGDFLQGKDGDSWVLSTKVGRLLKPDVGPPTDIADFVNGLKFGVEFDYSYDGIMRSIEDSYARLGLTKIDIAYVHDIGRFTHSPEMNDHHMAQLKDGGFRALDMLKDSGTIKAWGIGVNEVAVCLDVLERTELDCILLAGRYTLLDRSAEADLLPACRARDISIIVGGIFNSGILATDAVENGYFDYRPASSDIKARVSAMQAVAEKNGHQLARAALQFPLREPLVVSMLLGTDTAEKLQHNLDELAAPLPDSNWDQYSNHALMD
nr:aldo/keto reductase [Hoeflea prorocentri]